MFLNSSLRLHCISHRLMYDESPKHLQHLDQTTSSMFISFVVGKHPLILWHCTWFASCNCWYLWGWRRVRKSRRLQRPLSWRMSTFSPYQLVNLKNIEVCFCGTVHQLSHSWCSRGCLKTGVYACPRQNTQTKHKYPQRRTKVHLWKCSPYTCVYIHGSSTANRWKSVSVIARM